MSHGLTVQFPTERNVFPSFIQRSVKRIIISIKISSKEAIDNITEYDYNNMIMDFEHKIKQYKIKNKIDALSKDFE